MSLQSNAPMMLRPRNGQLTLSMATMLSFGSVLVRSLRCRTKQTHPETKQALVRHTDAGFDILRSISDQPTIEGAKRLIADLEAQKAVLHPQREQ
jgi:hypothetical protein